MSQGKPSVSVIMPVYNEFRTISDMVSDIILFNSKKYDLQIIIIESNSTDGTRDLVKNLEKLEEVTAIYQDRPMGKGSAVREGIKIANGFVTLIFDGDREYSAKDIEILVTPILENKVNFVLGSRFKIGEPMRSFGKSRIRSTILNLVHIGFAHFFSTIYQVKLKDPFTMFKVYRSECIKNLNFRENGFAFDVELVAKLIRNGNKPIEIPISYVSRGFSEGKKIRFFRDGYALPIAMLRHRFSNLFNL
jgi:glycosyltransferase involved in cell wall biosynthesis